MIPKVDLEDGEKVKNLIILQDRDLESFDNYRWKLLGILQVFLIIIKRSRS